MFFLFIFDYVSIQTGFEIYFYNYFYLLFLPGERERENEKETQRERIDGVLITALTTCFKG